MAGTSVNNPIDAHPRDREQMERMMHILCDSGSYDVVLSTSLGSGGGWPGGGRGRGRRGADPQSEESPEEAVFDTERMREGAKLLAKLQGEIGVPILYVQRGQGARASAEASAAFAEGIGTFPSVMRAAHTVRQLLEWRTRREGLPAIF